MQINHPSPDWSITMSKTIARRSPSTTTKWLIGLTVFFAILKTISNHR